MSEQFGLQRQAKFALLAGAAAERTETKAQPKPNRQPKPPPQISPPYAFALTSTRNCVTKLLRQEICRIFSCA
jgi:hypothetical protein